MTVHIDDWGTRRQYTSKVVQGTGGGGGSEPGGNVITATIDQSVANAVAAHEAKTDPHGQYIKVSQKGMANGVATLGDDGLMPLTQLPPAIAAGTLAAHVDPDGDPHRQYITAAKLAAALAGQRCRSYFISQI